VLAADLLFGAEADRLVHDLCQVPACSPHQVAVNGSRCAVGSRLLTALRNLVRAQLLYTS
jgi:hypothetical protein